jgi:hypothetical protein
LPATYSPEGRIENGLRELSCSGRNFVEIARAHGVKVSHGKFSECLNDKGRFDESTGEALLDLLAQMKQLQNDMKVQSLQESEKVPVAWGQAGRISTALALQKIRAEETAQQVTSSEVPLIRFRQN